MWGDSGEREGVWGDSGERERVCGVTLVRGGGCVG